MYDTSQKGCSDSQAVHEGSQMLICTLFRDCDRRAEAEVNWTGLTLIMFIVFVHSVKIAT